VKRLIKHQLHIQISITFVSTYQFLQTSRFNSMTCILPCPADDALYKEFHGFVEPRGFNWTTGNILKHLNIVRIFTYIFQNENLAYSLRKHMPTGTSFLYALYAFRVQVTITLNKCRYTCKLQGRER